MNSIKLVNQKQLLTTCLLFENSLYSLLVFRKIKFRFCVLYDLAKLYDFILVSINNFIALKHVRVHQGAINESEELICKTVKLHI